LNKDADHNVTPFEFVRVMLRDCEWSSDEGNMGAPHRAQAILVVVPFIPATIVEAELEVTLSWSRVNVETGSTVSWPL
jgi:hypothetical protein